jgi:hypothetical protein
MFTKNYVVYILNKQSGYYYPVASNFFENLSNVQEYLSSFNFPNLTSQDITDFQRNHNDHRVTKYYGDRGYTVEGCPQCNPFDYEPLI